MAFEKTEELKNSYTKLYNNIQTKANIEDLKLILDALDNKTITFSKRVQLLNYKTNLEKYKNNCLSLTERENVMSLQETSNKNFMIPVELYSEKEKKDIIGIVQDLHKKGFTQKQIANELNDKKIPKKNGKNLWQDYDVAYWKTKSLETVASDTVKYKRNTKFNRKSFKRYISNHLKTELSINPKLDNKQLATILNKKSVEKYAYLNTPEITEQDIDNWVKRYNLDKYRKTLTPHVIETKYNNIALLLNVATFVSVVVGIIIYWYSLT